MSDVKRALSRKLGPLPAWVWAVVAGAAIYFYRNRHAGPASVAPDSSALLSPPSDVAPPLPPADSGAAGTGPDAGAEAGVFPFPDNKIAGLQGDLRTAVYDTIDQLRKYVDDAKTLADETAAGDAGAGGGTTPTDISATTPDSTHVTAAKGKASSRARKGKHSGTPAPKRPRARPQARRAATSRKVSTSGRRAPTPYRSSGARARPAAPPRRAAVTPRRSAPRRAPAPRRLRERRR